MLLREITKKTEEKVELSHAATLEDLLRTLSTKYGDLFRGYVFDPDGNIKENLLILLNGRSLDKHKELFGMTLGQEDILAILSPRSGG
jgi:MoaD family protein